MTFEEMVKIEPQLGILRDEAIQRSKELPNRAWAKRSEVWYREFRPRFIKLVGFMAEKPELRTSEIYSAVYETFTKILKCV